MIITSLFSTFDPASSISILPNWIIIFRLLIIAPKNKWWINQYSSIFSKIIQENHQSTKTDLIRSYTPGSTIIIFSLLYIILIINLWGICPHIFTLTSHLAVTLSLGLPFWVSFIIYGWVNSPLLIFAHIVPNGTPIALTIFIVLIETLSNIVRPLTLSLRLAANLMAGHILMSLVGTAGIRINLLILPAFILLYQFLILLECIVALIQPVVFSILVKIYAREVNYVKF